ncbi:MAG: cbb3-type cytochrome c oxidase subunit 3 [Gammaproteobacteria bacterium]|nr:cbb3-type cytochrome c oxidase subunit 3 [Gammaproteobacteria bacterium]
MDMNVLRGLMTVLAVILFIGIYWWAFSKHRKQAFDEAAQLPFVEDMNASAAKTYKDQQL